jgi:GNAT superfamily N-acetyltransferase
MSETRAASDEVSIRAARVGDLPVIVAMRDELNALELRGSPHAPIRHLSVAEFTALWGRTLDDPNYCWRIIEAGSEAIGYGLIYLTTPLTEPPAAFLHWAYLAESARRRGLGRELLEHLVQWARTQRADRIELQFIEGNLPAQQFWTKMGFQPYAQKCVRYLTDRS